MGSKRVGWPHRTVNCPGLLHTNGAHSVLFAACSRVMLAALKFFLGQDAAEDKGDGGCNGWGLVWGSHVGRCVAGGWRAASCPGGR